MAKTTKTTEKVYPESLFVMWLNQNKEGVKYYSSTGLIIEINSKKENPNEPDLRIYHKNEDGTKGKQYASLWVNTAANGNKYLSGTLSDGKKTKLTGFIKKENAFTSFPYANIYLDSDLPKREKKEVKEKPATMQPSDDELPF